MARTKASVGAKVSSVKSSKARCSVSAPSTIGTSSGGSDKVKLQSGGNPVCPRDTPGWQKPITTFFIGKEAPGSGIEPESASLKAQTRKRNVIHSDDEDDTTDQPSNTTNQPSNTTNQPSNTIDQPSNTTDQPSNTTDQPSNTTDQPSDTTESSPLPLTAEDNHTMDEYLKEKPDKGKGIGKRSNKENDDGNTKKRDSSDLDLDTPSGKKARV